MEVVIHDAEFKLMELLWKHGQINSTELVKLCMEELNWKKSTTYTNIKRLSERGIIKNENAVVSPLISREEVSILESRSHLKKLYDGSINLLVAGFLKHEELSEGELLELKSMIDKELKKTDK